jgi:hypothetical protein
MDRLGKQSGFPFRVWVITKQRGAAPTALGIILRCPSPSGLGSRFGGPALRAFEADAFFFCGSLK